MALEQLTGQKVAVSAAPMRSENVDPPQILVRANGETVIKALAARLLGVTGIWGPETSGAITAAASQIPVNPNYVWTQDDAEKILAATGATPLPAYVSYWTMKGQGEVVFRVVPPTFPGAKKLTYPKRSKQPRLSLLPVLRQEVISIPEGVVLEVPVKLKLDSDGLVLSAALRLGKARQTTEVSESETK